MLLGLENREATQQNGLQRYITGLQIIIMDFLDPNQKKRHEVRSLGGGEVLGRKQISGDCNQAQVATPTQIPRQFSEFN